MVLVHHNAVMVLATSIAAATWMLAVLANATVASRDVAALLAVGLQACGIKQLGSTITRHYG
jgi:hypothetical protein